MMATHQEQTARYFNRKVQHRSLKWAIGSCGRSRLPLKIRQKVNWLRTEKDRTESPNVVEREHIISKTLRKNRFQGHGMLGIQRNTLCKQEAYCTFMINSIKSFVKTIAYQLARNVTLPKDSSRKQRCSRTCVASEVGVFRE
jgi:hypothetical protein